MIHITTTPPTVTTNGKPDPVRLAGALRRVTALFGKEGWPRIEVLLAKQDRRVLPISDDDADHVRYARKLLESIGK